MYASANMQSRLCTFLATLVMFFGRLKFIGETFTLHALHFYKQQVHALTFKATLNTYSHNMQMAGIRQQSKSVLSGQFFLVIDPIQL